MTSTENMGILALKEEYEKVKESGKLQKILNFRWELCNKYSRLIQEGNRLSFQRQHKAQQKISKETDEIYKIILSIEGLLK